MNTQNTRYPIHTAIFLLFLAWLILPNTVFAAQIVVEPGTTVRAGEEVLFNASSYLIENPSLNLAKFEWEFGDTYALWDTQGGASVTHVYQYPGQYNVNFYIRNSTGLVTQASIQINVTGSPNKASLINLLAPLVGIGFENTLSDASGHSLIVSYPGADQHYVVGPIGKGFDLNGSYVRVQNTAQFSNLNKFTISFYARKKSLTQGGVIFDTGSIVLRHWSEWTMSLGVTTSNGNFSTGSNWETQSHNTSWNHYVVMYDGATLRLYINGSQVGATACAGTVNLGSNLILGADQAGNSIFNGEIDEFSMSDKALSVEALSSGFELRHADFHGRTAQYIYAQIPAELINYSVRRLSVKVTSDSGYNNTLYDKTNPQPEEKMLLRNADLPIGNYTLTAQLLDASNNLIAETREYFEKPYNGVPISGIDENNAIRINGNLFYPVTPWGLNDPLFPQWLGANSPINSLYGIAFWLGSSYGATRNLESWQYYLSQCQTYNKKALGPTMWDGTSWDAQVGIFGRTNLNRLIEYVETCKNHNSTLAWSWMDEPDGGGGTSSPVLRSWTYASHKHDPQHIVATTYLGPPWLNNDPGAWETIMRRKYAYLYNADLFGGKKIFPTDIIGFDFYPIEWAAPHPRNATVAQLADIIDKIKNENYNLAPIFSWVESSDINEPPYPNPYPPTPGQLTMLTWLNVIHGVKGINWFHYHLPTPAENFVVMKKFLDQITALTPVVLGPEVKRTVTDSANTQGNRVDTMIREYSNNAYIFAVRLTEVPEASSPAINVTFNVSGITNALAEVYDEARTVNVMGGAFQDSFAPNAVHIYKIPISGGVTYGDVSGDGKITAYDAALTAQAAVALITLTSDQAKAADVDGNGEVTAYDAALIAQYAVGIIDHFPVRE